VHRTADVGGLGAEDRLNVEAGDDKAVISADLTFDSSDITATKIAMWDLGGDSADRLTTG
jgi:hypothetical protein